MPANSVQPPVQLSADMDNAQQAAFINQNFQNIATFLQSDFLQVVQTGTVSLTKPANATGGDANVTHGLGYTPVILSYVTDGAFIYPFGNVGVSFTGATSGLVTLTANVLVDTTTLYFSVVTPNWAGNGNYTSAATYSIRYYLLKESAS